MNRRDRRRKRRVRNQIISYIVAVLLLAGLVTGGFFGVRNISNAMEEKKQQEESRAQEESQAQAEAEEQTGTETETAGEAATETESVQTQEEILEELVESCVANMSLEDKVAGLFFITPEQLTGVGTAIQAGEGTQEALKKYPVGGLVYFAKNIQSEEQLTEMLSKTAGYATYPLFLGVDEEGGTVARVADQLKLANVGPMADIGAGGDPNAAYAAGQTIGSYLKGYGFNLDFAPVADVLTNPDNKVIKDRAFGSDAAVVSQMVASAVQGLQDTGVSACIKHFPGHGDTSGDSHEGAVETDRTAEEMQGTEFLPFQAGIDAGTAMVMVGHISAPALADGDATPASINEKIISGVLRNQLGYEGIVITDAMNMSAISEYYTADEAAVKALKAGADMILMPEDFVTAYEGVVNAVKDGTIDENRINDSLKRVYRVKYADTLKGGL